MGESIMPQYITISEYNSEWQKLFEREAVLIKKIMGDNCIAVYHIGSTSVPGLAAKPIIGLCGSYIAGLFARNNMQSQGIGAKLIACAKAKKTSLELNVYANNVNAVKFYEREGFVISKEGKASYTGQKDYHMVWRKDAQALK